MLRLRYQMSLVFNGVFSAFVNCDSRVSLSMHRPRIESIHVDHQQVQIPTAVVSISQDNAPAPK